MNLGKCKKCGKKAITAINAGETPLCAYHYIEQEDEECLKALLEQEIEEDEKITEPKDIQLEIKKQKPSLYFSLKEYFSI